LKLIVTSVIFVIATFCCKSFAFVDVSTELIKYDDAVWSVTYRADTPVKQMALRNTTNRSRQDRWIPESAKFSIFHEKESDYIRRDDGKAFTKVTFLLTPTYTVLPKYYAPFSPFNDGGILFHSGRFFACAEECSDDLNRWPMTLRVPNGDKIVLSGKVRFDSASWVASNDGQNIYVGTADLIETEHFISVIDSSLPSNLKGMFNDHLARLMDQYASRLGARSSKAMLFASYGDKTKQDTHGHQGGVLPGQVFMHWYGNVFDQGVDEYEIFRFFSHEVAHLYQGENHWADLESASWIHEGTADLMASISLAENFPESQEFVAKFAGDAVTSCIDRLGGDSLLTALVAKKKHDLNYSCGLTISHAIQNEALRRNDGVDIFTIWNKYAENIEKTGSASIETFFESVKPFVSGEFLAEVKALSSDENVDSGAKLRGLLSTGD